MAEEEGIGDFSKQTTPENYKLTMGMVLAQEEP